MVLNETPSPIAAWQRALRRMVLRVGVTEVARRTGARRSTVYAWAHPTSPVFPSCGDRRAVLEEMMGIGVDATACSDPERICRHLAQIHDAVSRLCFD